MRSLLALFAAPFLSVAETQAPVPSEPLTLIRCGTLIDGVSAAPRRDVLLQVQGNRIVGVREHARTWPRDRTAKLVDLESATCLPGLIDVHVHLLRQDPERHELRTPAESLSSDNLLRTLRYGFTTVRNLGTQGMGPSDVDVRDAVANGSLPGPRLKVAMSDSKTREFGAKNSADLLPAVNRIASQGSDWVKLYDSELPGPETGERYTEEEIAAVVEEAHHRGMKVAMHTVPFAGSHRAIVGGVDSIEHGVNISDADLKTMKDRGITYVPTLFVIAYVAALPGRDDTAKWEGFLTQSYATYDRALKAKVRIAFGSDAGVAGWTSNPAQ